MGFKGTIHPSENYVHLLPLISFQTYVVIFLFWKFWRTYELAKFIVTYEPTISKKHHRRIWSSQSSFMWRTKRNL